MLTLIFENTDVNINSLTSISMKPELSLEH